MKYLKNCKEILNGKTVNRVAQNYYAGSLEIVGRTIDLGSKSASPSYYDHFDMSNVTKLDFADLHSSHPDVKKIDLTKPFDLEKETYDTVILFNVIEHLPSYNLTISECARILAPNGKLHVIVPFFFPHHDDPKDYRRFTLDGLRQIASHTQLHLVSSHYPKVSPLLVLTDFASIWILPRPIRHLLRPVLLSIAYLLGSLLKLIRGKFNNIDAMKAFAPFYGVTFQKLK